MKTIVLLALVALIPQIMPAKVAVPEYKREPIIVINEDGEYEWYYPPFEKPYTGIRF